MLFAEIFLEHWLAIAVISYIVYRIYGYIYFKIKERQLGAKPFAHDDTDWFFGIPLFFKTLRQQRDGTATDYTAERYNLLNRDSLSFSLLGKHLIATRDPENIKAMLATQFDDFCLGKRHQHFEPLLGEGIFTLDGQGWKHSRAMLRPQFVREQVGHVMALEPHVQLLAKQIKLYNGKEFDIQELFFRFTVDTATEFLFGESVSSLQDSKINLKQEMEDVVNFDGKNGFAEAFNKSQKTLSFRTLAQQLYFLFDGKDFRSNVAKVHVFGDYYVQKALNATPEELEEKSKGGYIFLYELVKETRDPKILRDQLLNILLAGRDTTAGLLSFSFFELARRSDVWNKLKDEIETNFGSGSNSRVEEITFESLKRCTYLKAVLNEILRLYPSVPRNTRYATKDTTLPRGGGPDGKSPIFIPKGKTVVYSVHSMHKDKKYYGEDVDIFRPERWLTGETKRLGWAYLPFNGGPRICLGQQFALTEASFVIVRLLQIFPNIESFDDEYPAKKASYLTMCHKKGVFIGLS